MLDVNEYEVIDASKYQINLMCVDASYSTYQYVKADANRLSEIPVKIFNFFIEIGVVVKK